MELIEPTFTYSRPSSVLAFVAGVWVLCADGHFSFPSYIKEYPKKAQTLDGTTKA